MTLESRHVVSWSGDMGEAAMCAFIRACVQPRQNGMPPINEGADDDEDDDDDVPDLVDGVPSCPRAHNDSNLHVRVAKGCSSICVEYLPSCSLHANGAGSSSFHVSCLLGCCAARDAKVWIM
jgi:hypothetical protein